MTFPPSNANHNPDQVFYYDERFMLRRMDYSPEVTGSPPIAQYTHDPKTFDGFVFPTRRLMHRRDADGVADQSVALLTFDIDAVAVERCCCPSSTSTSRSFAADQSCGLPVQALVWSTPREATLGGSCFHAATGIATPSTRNPQCAKSRDAASPLRAVAGEVPELAPAADEHRASR